MRPTWKTIRNEIKRGDSVELSRLVLFLNYSQVIRMMELLELLDHLLLTT